MLAMGVEVFITSSGDARQMSISSYMPLMEQAVALGLPMLCGNPDLHVSSDCGTCYAMPLTTAAAITGICLSLLKSI